LEDNKERYLSVDGNTLLRNEKIEGESFFEDGGSPTETVSEIWLRSRVT